MPSLRERQRYIAYEILSDKLVNSKAIREEFYSKIKGYLGSFGMAEAGVMMLEEAGNKGIIRTNSKNVDKVRAALILVKNINGNKVIIKTLGVSGILNKALKYI